MTIAVLTYHNSSNNCGAVLQAFATQTAVEKLGHSAKIIDFYRRADLKKWWSFCSLGGIYHTILRFGPEWIRLARCRQFRERFLHLTVKEVDHVTYSDAEAYITGSDQVFNPANNEHNSDFLLSFAPEEARRISYGASFGSGIFSNGDQQMMKKFLPKFDAVSVREESAVDIIHNLTGQVAQVVVDPTLLLSAEEYYPLMSPRKVKEPFVLLYLIGHHTDAFRVAEAKAKELGVSRILVLSNGRAEWHLPQFGMVRRIYIFSPSDFLRLIHDAQYVVTNSFHGTAFSLIFRRKFHVLMNGTDADGRMKTLLDRLRPEEEDFNRRWDEYREQSLSFLSKALSERGAN